MYFYIPCVLIHRRVPLSDWTSSWNWFWTRGSRSGRWERNLLWPWGTYLTLVPGINYSNPYLTSPFLLLYFLWVFLLNSIFDPCIFTGLLSTMVRHRWRSFFSSFDSCLLFENRNFSPTRDWTIWETRGSRKSWPTWGRSVYPIIYKYSGVSKNW